MKTVSSLQSTDRRLPTFICRLQLAERLIPVVLEVVTVMLLLTATIGVSLFARINLPRYVIDLTHPTPTDELNMVGFHALEQNESFTYRWSSGYTFVQLPSGYHAASRYLASARVWAAHPQEPQPLTFVANERELVTVLPDRSTFRTYHLLLAAPADGEATLRFALQTIPFSPPGDVRSLGVILTNITIQPLPYRDGSVALLLAFGLTGLWGWMRWRGGTRVSTLLVCAVLATFLLLLYALYRPAPLRYPWLASVALLASAAGMLIVQATVARLALALLATLVSFGGTLWPSWFSDDTFISFQYAKNLVAGHGLVYNIGERVEGYTNFLWTMLAALVLWLGRDPVFWVYVAGVVLAPTIVLMTCWLALRLMDVTWALVATLFVATSQSLLIYTSRGAGLETGFFTLLVLISSAFYVLSQAGTRKTYALLTGCGFALATLTRPEGVLVMGVTAIHLLFTGSQEAFHAQGGPAYIRLHPGQFIGRCWRILREPLVLILGAYLIIILPYFLWRLTYYGDLLPNTFYAKTGGGVPQVLRGLRYAQGFALAFGGPLLLVLLLPLGIDWRTTVTSWRGYLTLLVAVYSTYIILVGGDHFRGERFFVPLIPWLAILMADGGATICRWSRRTPLFRSFTAVMLSFSLLLFSGYALLRTASFDHILRGLDESVWIWRELGWWMHDHAGPEESIAVMGAGAIAYYANRTTVDLLGLNEKHIARVAMPDMGTGAAGHEKRDPGYVLHVRQPTYIPRMWDDYFGGEEILQSYYTLITIHTRYGREMELWKRLP